MRFNSITGILISVALLVSGCRGISEVPTVPAHAGVRANEDTPTSSTAQPNVATRPRISSHSRRPVLKKPKQNPGTPETPETHEEPAPGDITHVEPSKPVSNFAQSIEGVTLVYEPSPASARLGFYFLDFDQLDPAGRPALQSVPDLSGNVGADGTASLVNPRFPEYSATLTCLDQPCQRARIEILKSTGKFSGKALIKRTVLKDTCSIIEYGTPSENGGTQTLIHDSMQADPYRVDLVTQEIEDGGKTLFEFRLHFSNQLRKAGDTDHFDSKTAFITGETGKKVLLQLTHEQQGGANAGTKSSRHHADVRFDPARSLLNVTILEDEGLANITGGRMIRSQSRR